MRDHAGQAFDGSGKLRIKQIAAPQKDIRTAAARQQGLEAHFATAAAICFSRERSTPSPTDTFLSDALKHTSVS